MSLKLTISCKVIEHITLGKNTSCKRSTWDCFSTKPHFLLRASLLQRLSYFLLKDWTLSFPRNVEKLSAGRSVVFLNRTSACDKGHDCHPGARLMSSLGSSFPVGEPINSSGQTHPGSYNSSRHLEKQEFVIVIMFGSSTFILSVVLTTYPSTLYSPKYFIMTVTFLYLSNIDSFHIGSSYFEQEGRKFRSLLWFPGDTWIG